MWLYALLSVLLLFTAAIVSNIEAIQQTLNVTLANAYLHVFVPVEALIWIRSLAIVLLIVAHAMRHVQIAKQPLRDAEVKPLEQQPLPLAITPELLDVLRDCLAQAQTTIVTETPETRQLASPAQATDAQLLESMLHVLDKLLPDVSLAEITAVVSTYRDGTGRRDICGALHWGASKYSTIVKPVLDAYERLQQTA